MLLAQLNMQKEMFELQEKQRKQEMDVYVKELEAEKLKNLSYCEDWRCKECNPPPADHPEYGPPVYDPYFKVWTFPYALNIPRKVFVKKEVPKIQVSSCEVQC